MENKEVFLVTLVLAVVFALLSIVSDFTITGSAVKNLNNNFSLTFSIITIVLVIIILLSLVIEIWKFKKFKE